MNILHYRNIIACRVLLGGISTLGLCCLSFADLTKDERIELRAKELQYDKKKDTFTAFNDVTVAYRSQLLKANKLQYDRMAQNILALGEIEFHKSTGETLYADSAQLSDDFANGSLNHLEVILKNNSRIKAEQGQLTNQEKLTLSNASYTACHVCKASLFPFWNIKARQITYDHINKTLTYEKATLEVKGKPIFYFPFFSHSLIRKSGFLIPSLKYTSDLGVIVKIPYYWAISPDKELTFTPVLSNKELFILSADYNHRFANGLWNLNTSITPLKIQFSGNLSEEAKSTDKSQAHQFSALQKKRRWHIFSHLRYEVNDRDLVKISLNRASDTAYLRRFALANNPYYHTWLTQPKSLMSSISFEHFDNLYYYSVSGIGFQTGADAVTPSLAPLMYYHYVSSQGKYNQFYELKSNFVSFYRSRSQASFILPNYGAKNMHRFNLQGSYELPYITKNGHRISMRLKLRNDLYFANGYQDRTTSLNPSTTGASNQDLSFKAMRLFPQAALGWSYPLINTFTNKTKMNSAPAYWLLEPQARLIASPNISQENYPNEESFTPELDRSNLFLMQRFSGWDRIDHGSRFIYGLSSTWRKVQGSSLSLFAGQSMRMDNKKIWPEQTHETNHASPIVLRGVLNLNNILQFTQGATINYRNGHILSSQSAMNFNYNNFSSSVNYVFLAKRASFFKTDVSQINWDVGLKANKNWAVSFSQGVNLKKHTGGTLYSVLKVEWQNECFKINFGLYQTSYQDRDVKPDKGVLLEIRLKYLGDNSTFS